MKNIIVKAKSNWTGNKEWFMPTTKEFWKNWLKGSAKIVLIWGVVWTAIFGGVALAVTPSEEKED